MAVCKKEKFLLNAVLYLCIDKFVVQRPIVAQKVWYYTIVARKDKQQIKLKHNFYF